MTKISLPSLFPPHRRKTPLTKNPYCTKTVLIPSSKFRNKPLACVRPGKIVEKKRPAWPQSENTSFICYFASFASHPSAVSENADRSGLPTRSLFRPRSSHLQHVLPLPWYLRNPDTLILDQVVEIWRKMVLYLVILAKFFASCGGDGAREATGNGLSRTAHAQNLIT